MVITGWRVARPPHQGGARALKGGARFVHVPPGRPSPFGHIRDPEWRHVRWRHVVGADRTSVAIRANVYLLLVRVLELDGRLVEVHIRRSSRVRAHRAVVSPGRAPELVVRPRASEAEIDAALEFHGRWILRQVARLPEPRLNLDRLRLTEEAGRREARARITLIAQSEAMALGVRYTRLALRDQRSRWGSCSTTGALSFNWRLVLAPHDVLDYVVVHEVCHLIEHHHGPRFWALVRRRRPHYEDPKRWLADHGWEILAYQPPLAAAA
jgi:predicted metal-dependent hydrolase